MKKLAWACVAVWTLCVCGWAADGAKAPPTVALSVRALPEADAAAFESELRGQFAFVGGEEQADYVAYVEIGTPGVVRALMRSEGPNVSVRRVVQRAKMRIDLREGEDGQPVVGVRRGEAAASDVIEDAGEAEGRRTELYGQLAGQLAKQVREFVAERMAEDEAAEAEAAEAGEGADEMP